MGQLKAVVNIVLVIVYLFLFSFRAFAQSAEEKSFLSMYFKEEDLVVQSATRSPQPLSQVADNMTVVTAADIELMNAHTLAEVLNTVAGVEVWMSGGPGQKAQADILGSFERHVTVIMDGVVMNSLWSGIAEIGMIPVQNIEKIEIIKGPASSAWGSALGGVVNIITKAGRSVDQGGIVYASIGEKNFGDFRAEARGKQDRFGYYLTAGRLQSDGLTPHLSVLEHNAYSKLSYDIAENTDIALSLAYAGSRRDDYYNNYWPDPTWAGSGDSRNGYFHSAFAVNSRIVNNVDLNISFWLNNQYTNDGSTDLATFIKTYAKDKNEGYGTSAKLAWKTDRQTVVFGTDSSNMTDKIYVLPNGEQSVRKWAVYANDTMSLGRLTVIPGLRFDSTNSNGDVTSPSLGITYGLDKSTIFRAYAAKGFSIPKTGETFGYLNGWIGNPNLTMETVWSFQAGIETAALKYAWLKLSFFRNEIRNLIDYVVLDTGDIQFQNIGHERREGVLIEAKTKPVYNTSLSAAAELTSAKDRDTGETVHGVPVQVYDIGVRYDDQSSLKVLLQGRHINWNVRADDVTKYHSILLDLNVIKKVLERRDAALELFVNAHNLLNTTQYATALFPNPERWYEGGVRYRF